MSTSRAKNAKQIKRQTSTPALLPGPYLPSKKVQDSCDTGNTNAPVVISTCFCQWQNKLKMLKLSSLKNNILSLLKRKPNQTFLDT